MSHSISPSAGQYDDRPIRGLTTAKGAARFMGPATPREHPVPYGDEPSEAMQVQTAEVAVPRHLFADILRLIAELRPPPVTSTA